jgi:hypothetical protein
MGTDSAREKDEIIGWNLTSNLKIKIGIRRFLLLGRAESRKNSQKTDRKGHRGDFLGNWELGRNLGIKTQAYYKNLCFDVLQLVHNVEACPSVRPDLYTRAYNWDDSEARPGPSTEDWGSIHRGLERW